MLIGLNVYAYSKYVLSNLLVFLSSAKVDPQLTPRVSFRNGGVRFTIAFSGLACCSDENPEGQGGLLLGEVASRRHGRHLRRHLRASGHRGHCVNHPAHQMGIHHECTCHHDPALAAYARSAGNHVGPDPADQRHRHSSAAALRS